MDWANPHTTFSWILDEYKLYGTYVNYSVGIWANLDHNMLRHLRASRAETKTEKNSVLLMSGGEGNNTWRKNCTWFEAVLENPHIGWQFPWSSFERVWRFIVQRIWMGFSNSPSTCSGKYLPEFRAVFFVTDLTLCNGFVAKFGFTQRVHKIWRSTSVVTNFLPVLLFQISAILFWEWGFLAWLVWINAKNERTKC